ncbi:hypothetical protein J437_LFUL001403 [Ladona fulva]|uniref:Uncharacterized protein n=1 Tax=Ladona fulva TaxID=123851 RepID=A0A8K0NT82_LADFU|nr:hypothetical protein J437_LFUL001403 [Ladona fulva]
MNNLFMCDESTGFSARCSHRGVLVYPREANAGRGAVVCVMDWGPDPGSPEKEQSSKDRRRRSLHPSTPLLLFCLLMAVPATASLGCKGLEHCDKEYKRALDEREIARPGPSAAYCHVLRQYGDCIRMTSCRGNLKYHTASSLVSAWIAEYNCSSHTAAAIRPWYTATASPPPDLPCTFRGRKRLRHCGLSGDPHLKTFNHEFMTCKIKGAWPLIDNPYLAVQVTNEPVAEGSPATSTTKVTIIIKSKSSGCSTEKTYEATGDAPLPTSFIDGSRRSGPADAVSISVADGGSRVEIRMRHIDATLVVRRLGKYLAFSARMPEEIAMGSPKEQEVIIPEANAADLGGWGEIMQLCVSGCPPSERLEAIPGTAYPLLSWEEAEERCRRWNLTDHYLDWCVFDSLSAPNHRDIDLAAAAAYAAQADVNRLDPDGAATVLKNRTAARRMIAPPHSAQSSLESIASSAARPSTSIAFLLLLVVLTRHAGSLFVRNIGGHCGRSEWEGRTISGYPVLA